MEIFDPYSFDESSLQQATIDIISKHFIKFDKFSHKGTRGHAAVISGSKGMMGAAILSGTAANRSGCGLTTMVVPDEFLPLIHMAIPEALVKVINLKSLDIKIFDSIAIGPGIGQSDNIVQFMRDVLSLARPLVIDADALNILSFNRDLFDKIPSGSILTPHPKEWERLFGNHDSYNEKINVSLDYSTKTGVFIILKGHFSALICPDGNIHFNGTGNAGMAKAGCGDVLTGLLAGLLAQGYSPKIASILGMYIHGLAGDFAEKNLGQQAMTASDLISYFPAAFQELEKGLS